MSCCFHAAGDTLVFAEEKLTYRETGSVGVNPKVVILEVRVIRRPGSPPRRIKGARSPRSSDICSEPSCLPLSRYVAIRSDPTVLLYRR